MYNFLFIFFIYCVCLFYEYYFSEKTLDNKNKEIKTILNEKYKKLRILGSGSQGKVFEVEDVKDNRKK